MNNIINKYRYGLILVLLATFAISCGENKGDIIGPEPPQDHDSTTTHPPERPSVDGSIPTTTITWEKTARKISVNENYAEYGRIVRINGDTLLLSYHSGTKTKYKAGAGVSIVLRRSVDNGETWSAPDVVVKGPQPGYRGFQNPNILELQNGWLLLSFVGRGRPDDNEHDGVLLCISKDRGYTWSDPKVIANGRSWEPAMIQLPDGTIDLFYSSEAKWFPPVKKKNQEILMIKSKDNGLTWTSPVTVAYTPGKRDGMPVPLILKGGKGIVFSIESVRNRRSPWIVWSSLEANFNYENYGKIGNGRRWPVFTPQSIHGGGPYIIQLPSGETVLSMQCRCGRKISFWKKSTMVVLVGNSMATHFTNISHPWPNLPTDEGAYFSSLFLKDDSTIVLVTTRNFPDGHSEIWWKEGYLHYQ